MNIRHNALTPAVLALTVAGLALPSHAAKSNSNSGPKGPSGGVVTGTITAVDATAGTITVTSSSGTVSTIAYTTKTNVIDHKVILASALAVGDTLDVSGTLVAVNATAVAKVTTTTTTTSTTTTGGTISGSGAGCPSPVSGSVRLTGVVATLWPLTLTVGSSLTVTLNTTDSTTLTEVGAGTSADLATGEAVTVLVNKSKSGTLTAASIDVTLA